MSANPYAFLGVTPDTYAPLQSVVVPVISSQVTQGLYARTRPTPDTGGSPIQPMCVDPNQTGVNGTGRLWCVGTAFGQIGFTDDNGATWTGKKANPGTNTGPAIESILITANYMWVTVGGSDSPCSGQIWRSPAPNAGATNISFTLIFDLNGQALGTGGASSTANTNSAFRNSCFAVSSDETVAVAVSYGTGNFSTTRVGNVTDAQMVAGSPLLYSATGNWTASDLLGPAFSVAGAGTSGAALTGVTAKNILSPNLVILSAPAQTTVTGATVTFAAGTFGAGVVVGGPQVWVSANPTNATPTFALERTFTMAKHVHAVHYINGVFWVTTGDTGHPFTDQTSYTGTEGSVGISDIGLWNSTTKAATTWNRVSIPDEFEGGSSRDIINFQPITVASQAALLAESDGNVYSGPVLFGSQTQGVGRALVPACFLPWPYLGTMRSLGIDPTTGNAYWVTTGESGGVGPLDTVMMAAPPYTVSIPLESATTNTTFAGTLGDPVISNGYFWVGKFRCVEEKIIGQ